MPVQRKAPLKNEVVAKRSHQKGKGNVLCSGLDRQLSVQSIASPFIGPGDASGEKPDPRVFLYIEIGLFFQVVIPYGKAGVYRSRVDGDVKTGPARILWVEDDLSVDSAKGTSYGKA